MLALFLPTQSDGANSCRSLGSRNATFVNEKILTIDDVEQRIAYSAFGGRATHHMSSMQVVPNGSGSRVIWITDFLPVDLRPLIAGNMEQGSVIMKKTLEAQAKSNQRVFGS